MLVGDTGIEPVTSSVSGKRATAAPIARGADGIRTRVRGFAGRCLASRPPHRKAESTGLAPSGRRDSNPRPSPWQGDALPAEPRPQRVLAGRQRVLEAVERVPTVPDRRRKPQTQRAFGGA